MPNRFWQCFSRFERLLSNLNKILFTEPCPNCGVSIQKDEGCDHMVCAKCKHEYCWRCLGPYSDYQH